MICPCGKPMGHTGRHRTYATVAERDEARRLSKLRAAQVWQQRKRARGLCVTCGRQTERFARCLRCREKDAAYSRERRQRDAA